MRTPARRVMVIGLDCATPQFVFGTNRFDLPNLRRLMASGWWGLLKSCDPPITVPAWSCMTTGKDPGELGVYGFRNRRTYSYDSETLATSHDVRGTWRPSDLSAGLDKGLDGVRHSNARP